MRHTECKAYRLMIYMLIFWPLYSRGIHALSRSESRLAGTFISLRDRSYAISDITIGGQKQNIVVYQGPLHKNRIVPQLDFNPQCHPLTLDLRDIRAITVPYPYATWFYRPHPLRRYTEKYLLLEVWSHEPTAPPLIVLVEPKRRVGGIVMNKKSAQHKRIPLSGIKELRFNAYTK